MNSQSSSSGRSGVLDPTLSFFDGVDREALDAQAMLRLKALYQRQIGKIEDDVSGIRDRVAGLDVRTACLEERLPGDRIKGHSAILEGFMRERLGTDLRLDALEAWLKRVEDTQGEWVGRGKKIIGAGFAFLLGVIGFLAKALYAAVKGP